MGQKTNYFKSYFKGYGIFSTLLVAIIYGVLGYFVYKSTNYFGAQVTDIAFGALIASLAGFAVIGLTSIKSEKIGLLDFLRVSGLISSIAVLVMVLLAKEVSTKSLITYIVLAVVFLAEIIVRFIYANDENPVSSKNYYGSIAGKYNPIIILILGVGVAVALYFFAKEGLWNIGETAINNKYLLFGGALILGMVALISALDKNTETTLFDFVSAVFFVASLYFIFIGAGVVSVAVLKLVLLFFGLFAGILLVRGFTYNKEQAYPNSSHKVRTYFLQTYNTFSIPFAAIIALVIVFAFGIPAAKLVEGNSITTLFGAIKDNTITIFSVVAIVLAAILIVLTLVFRKFKSTKIEKVDFLLVIMLLAGAFAIPYILVTVLGKNFSILTDNIVLLIAFGVIAFMFLYGAILQIVRLRSYDPLLAVVAQAEQQKQAEQAKEEENTFVEEEKAEEPKQEEEEKDPFALSEEDEKIYEEVYGKDETEEEPQEEVVEEEVVEEEPQEEEIVEEEVVEEEPQEEVQEEQPEEVVEQASEETEAEADDEEADDEEDEDDDDDEADDEEAEEEVEEKPEHVKTKEEQIITQDFQIVDQNTGEVKKIKRRFISKMMYAPYETKEYYNEIKNTLLSYRCKPRQSSRYETYRYKGLIAKVTLGGKAIKVYLALDPTFVEENPKYHLKDMSAKKQYKDVPVMIRVKSDRALKYFKEIVEILMTNRGVKPKKNFETQNYMGDLIPNGEAIMATLGMSNDYLVDSINVKSIPEDMPDDLANYLPMIPGEPLDEPEKVAAIYLDTLNNHFVDGAEITLDVLKSLNILKTGNTLKIKARGTLDKKLRIYAEYFDADALKMILCTSGTAIKIVRDQESIDQIVDEIPEEEQGTYNDAPVERQAQPEEASDDVVEEAPVQDEVVEDVANEEVPAEEAANEEVIEEAQEDAAPETDENGDVVVYQDDDGNYVDSNGNPFTEEQLREFGLIEDDSNE